MEFDCDQCGNCCPTDCPEFRVIQEEPRLTACAQYGQDDRGIICPHSANYWFACGYACRPVMTYLETARPDAHFVTSQNARGQRVYDLGRVPEEIRNRIFLKVIP